MNYSQIKELLEGLTIRGVGYGCVARIMAGGTYVVTYWGKTLMIFSPNGEIHFYLNEPYKSKQAWRINKLLPGHWNLRLVAYDEMGPTRYFLYYAERFIEEIESIGIVPKFNMAGTPDFAIPK